MICTTVSPMLEKLGGLKRCSSDLQGRTVNSCMFQMSSFTASIPEHFPCKEESFPNVVPPMASQNTCYACKRARWRPSKRDDYRAWAGESYRPTCLRYDLDS